MSGINPNFRTTQDFSGDTEVKIGRFEDATSKALGNIADQALPKLVPTNLKTADYVAMVGDLVPCAGTFNVTLPAPSSVIAGLVVGIELQSGTVTMRPTSGLVQGAASEALSTVGTYFYICDGTGFYRHASGGGGAGVTFTDFIQNIGKGNGGNFTIAGAGLTVGKDVLVVQTAQVIPTKGNARDEKEMDSIELSAYVKDAATIQVYWHATGIVVGDYAFGYQVSA